MPFPTNYQIQCRGSCGGNWADLFKQTKKDGSEGRYYYNCGRGGCIHHERLPPDIDNIDDLKEMVDVQIRMKEGAVPDTYREDDTIRIVGDNAADFNNSGVNDRVWDGEEENRADENWE